MSKLRDLLNRLLGREPTIGVSIQPTPKRARGKPDWRAQAIKATKAAAERHGKPFKVGPDHVAREVMVKPGEFAVTKPGELQHANVTPIAGKKARGQ